MHCIHMISVASYIELEPGTLMDLEGVKTTLSAQYPHFVGVCIHSEMFFYETTVTVLLQITLVFSP